MQCRLSYMMVVLLVLLTGDATSAYGQSAPVTLDRAVSIARENHAGLRSMRLTVDQRSRRAEAGPKKPPAQLSFTGEEFEFGGQDGIHSLNASQSFFLPGATRAQRRFDESEVTLARGQLNLSEHELRMEVGKAFYSVLYTRQMSILAHENMSLYEDFLQVTTAQLTSGETGKIPQLAARSRLGNAQLALEHSEERYDVALILFNQWLRADTQYHARGQLTATPEVLLDTIVRDNPHLDVHYAMIDRARANVVREQAQGLPQIRSGLSIQTATDLFPLFGYEVGLQIPIFKKAYRKHVEAAEVQIQVESAALEARASEIERNLSQLRYRLQHLLHVITYLRDDLEPILAEQQSVNRAAYLEGEIGYLEFLDTLEQEVRMRRQLLEALYEFNLLRLELEYWSGQ